MFPYYVSKIIQLDCTPISHIIIIYFTHMCHIFNIKTINQYFQFHVLQFILNIYIFLFYYNIFFKSSIIILLSYIICTYILDIRLKK